MVLKVIKGYIEKRDSLTLSKNLKILLYKYQSNPNQLAEILNIPSVTIRRLVSGETTDPHISTLKLIAAHFGISVDTLIEGNIPKNVEFLKKKKPYFVPKLDWETAEKIININELDLFNWQEWQSIFLDEHEIISKDAFALESRPSMYPRFPQGTVFIFDPDLTPTDGDLVLVKFKKNNEFSIRELVVDSPEWQLIPVVAGSNPIPYSKQDHKIVGINLLTILYNRKSLQLTHNK